MQKQRTIANRYALHHPIGQGGMGTVYRATDTRTGQTVAVKALKPEVVAHDPTLLTRFQRDGDSIRQINYPINVKMLDTVDYASRHYLVIEYVAVGKHQRE